MKGSRTPWRVGMRAALAGWMLVVAAGCGGGVAGTGSGTGDEGTDDIQYAPTALCKEDFAAFGLACTGDTRDPTHGTAPVQWADANKSNGGATVLADLEGNGMALRVPCLGLGFSGRWGELPDGTRAFVGRYVTARTIAGLPAIVQLSASPGEPEAIGWLQLTDAAGKTLYGPWLVRRTEGPVAFAECPGS